MPVGFLKFIKNNRFFSFYNIGSVGLVIGSAATCISNYSSKPVVEHNYLYRVALEEEKSDDKKKVKIENKTINYENGSELKSLLEKAKDNLSAYYKQNVSNETFVNLEFHSSNTTSDKKNTINLFLHQKTRDEVENKNRQWMDLVKLNQLTIDRYGHEWEDSGTKKTNSSLKIHPILKWKDINNNSLKVVKDSHGHEVIKLHFFNKNIEKTEIDAVANTDTNKFKYETSETNVSNDWFFWLDKEILAAKMNYAFVTWMFNQSTYASKNFVTDIVGADNTKKEIIKKNYENLSAIDREFAQTYEQAFRSEENKDAFSQNNLIKVDDLNKIYNKFSTLNKSLGIFSEHLLHVLKAGDNTAFEEAFQFKHDKSKALDASTTSKLNASINFSVDSKISPTLTNPKLVDFLKNNSVKGFNLNFFGPKNTSTSSSTTTTTVSSSTSSDLSVLWPSAIYSTDKKDGFVENMHVLYMPKTISTKNNWLLILSSILFFIGCGFIVSWLYKVPGLISMLWMAAASFVSGLLMYLWGVKFSELSFSVCFAMFLFGLGQVLLHLKRFQKSLKSGKSPLSAWVDAGKKTLTLGVDCTIILFVFSSLIAFAAPKELREFGVIVSIILFAYWLIFPFGTHLNVTQFLKEFGWKSEYYYGKISLDGAKLIIVKPATVTHLNKQFKWYIFGLIAISIYGIVFWFSGFNKFNSDLLFKNSYLLTVDTASESFTDTKNTAFNISDIAKDGVLTPIKIADNLKDQFYLFPENTNIETLVKNLTSKLKAGSFSIQKTHTYAETEIFIQLFHALKWIMAIISAYMWLRFGFGYFFNFLLSTIFIFSFFFSAVLLSYIKINSSLLYSILFLVMMIPIQSIWFAETTAKHKNETLLYSHQNLETYTYGFLFRNKKQTALNIGVFAFLLLAFSISYSASSFLIVLQLCFTLATIYLVCMPANLIIWRFLQVLKNKYYQLLSGAQNTNVIMEKLFSWDPYDEEIISGINEN